MSELEKSLHSIKEEYDAYFVANKYGTCTHEKEFNLLLNHFKTNEMALRALNWIKNNYDCYYIKEQDEEGPFYYLEQKLKGEQHE